ncbi:MAG TPA: acylphosphatase [Anaerolineales bacterium]|nr:acylphosphatase [Anaerolineales bacterium]
MELEPDENQRVHIWVTGRVHNVAFRAHVEYYALRIGVMGWVRNLSTDSVETVAEGTPSQIQQFIEMVKKGSPASQVDDVRVEYEPPTGQSTGFIVKKSV